MKWNDVTLSQFLELQEINKIEDETDKILSLAELFFGEEVTSLSLPEFNKKMRVLDFLKDEIPTNHIVKKVVVNKHEYTIDAVLGHMSTAQYVDFINFSKDESNIHKTLAVFFIPKGHKYNDGYDMEQVFEDMLSLPVDIVMSESFFFKRQFALFIKIFQSYSKRTMKKTNLPKEMKNNLTEVVDKSVGLLLHSLE